MRKKIFKFMNFKFLLFRKKFIKNLKKNRLKNYKNIIEIFYKKNEISTLNNNNNNNNYKM